MTYSEFLETKVGDEVIIRGNTSYRGARAIIIEPCIKHMSDDINVRIKGTNVEKEYFYKNVSVVGFKECKKEFKISKLVGKDDIFWSTENFSPRELDVIDRFLKEVNRRAHGVTVKSINLIGE